MKRHRTTAFGVIAMLGAGWIAGPATAQVDIGVALDNPGGTRTLYVENLTGTTLSSLDFENARSLPFRVRVVDATMDRTGFSVSASMTRLYKDTGSALDFTTFVPSGNVTLSNPADPLNVLSPTVLVEPLFNTLSTIPGGAICTLLALPLVGGNCTISTSSVTGTLQTVSLPVDLSDLSGLPLLPQQASAGAFTSPSFDGVAASDPAGSGAPAATSRQLITGTAVTTPAMLASVEGQLGTLLTGLALSDKIDTAVLTGVLRAAVGPLWDLLSPAQVTTVLGATTATLVDLVAGDLLAQGGTYMSFPQLNVSVPAEQAAGSYAGTLVITGLE